MTSLTDSALGALVERLISKDPMVVMLAGAEAADAIAALRGERDELEDVLLRGGFIRCDISACNCGSWHHRYGLPERFLEIKDALAEAGHELNNSNGNLVSKALASLVAERDALRAALDNANHLRSALENSVAPLRAEHTVLKAKIAKYQIMCDALLNHCDKENGECSECGRIVCPHKDSMHFHHDGCPSCAEAELLALPPITTL